MIKLVILSFLLNSEAKLHPADVQRYCYLNEPSLTVIVKAPTFEDGKAEAARSCFKALTGGKYQGEERSLEIIDTCVNPRPC